MADTQEFQQLLNIPIPNFPPFKLRSSLIDKDPVIWEYLLADYITLFKKLIALAPYSHVRKNSKASSSTGTISEIAVAPYVLSPKTINQLHNFLRTFLHESSLESTQVFSLGAINPNIRQNQHILKLAVFSYIKATNLINLKLTGVSVWEFCKVYLTMADKYATQGTNQAVVTIPIIRKLVEGTVRSSYTSKSDDVSLVRSLQDYLGKLIASGKWKQDDSEILYLLLGQRTTKKASTGHGNNGRNKNRNYKNVKVNSNSNGSEFAEKFVDKHWIQILEELYVGGSGINSKQTVQIMVLSMCSLSSAKILKLLKDQLEVDGLSRLKQFNPLVSNVVLSGKFNELNPDLKDQLSLLLLSKKGDLLHAKKEKKEEKHVFDDAEIQSVIDMFPQLSVGQVKTVLVKKGGDIAKVINEILEMNLDDIPLIEDYTEKMERRKAKKDKSIINKKSASDPKKFDFKMDDENVYSVQIGKKEVQLDETDEEYRKKTLERALSMLYDANEDEPDDTYVDNEIVSGSSEADNNNHNLDKKLLEVESKLFGIYSSMPDRLKRTDRNTPYRQELRRETGWTDEQIEGWARVLEKNPRRFRMLEERLVYVDGSLNQTGKKSTKWASKKDDEINDTSNDKRRGGRLPITSSNFTKYMDKKMEQKKEQKVRNNKTVNKSKTANHNRKSASLKKSQI